MYIVIELQTTNGTTGNFVFAFADLADAYAKYYSILSSAAKSSVELHTVLILTADGSIVRSERFDRREQSGEI